MPRQRSINQKPASTGLRFTVIGRGRWGSALGKTLEANGHEVIYLERGERYKPELFEARYVLIVTPFREMAKLLRKLSKYPKILGVVNASKGIDKQSLKTFTSLADPILEAPIATLSGPTFAKELKQKKPTACVIAGRNRKFVDTMTKAFSNHFFRCYSHFDPVGVDVCGALKNILAIAAGICEGLNLGANARAALLTRGLKEMSILVHEFGGKSSTVFGLAGVGDLWLTATGPLSRNRQFGYLLGKGKTKAQAVKEIGQTVEGLYTAGQVYRLLQKKKLDLPICREIYLAVYRNRSPRKSIESLMTRALKTEESSSWKLR